jgi:hypothetical protein
MFKVKENAKGVDATPHSIPFRQFSFLVFMRSVDFRWQAGLCRGGGGGVAAPRRTTTDEGKPGMARKAAFLQEIRG